MSHSCPTLYPSFSLMSSEPTPSLIRHTGQPAQIRLNRNELGEEQVVEDLYRKERRIGSWAHLILHSMLFLSSFSIYISRNKTESLGEHGS